MNINNPFFKRLFIFFLVLLGCFLILYFLSEGSISVPDASKYRNKLYMFTFYILPIILLWDFIYLFYALLKNALSIILVSLLIGLGGPLWLQYSIQTSMDPLAGMSKMLMVASYAVMSILALVVLTVIQKVYLSIKHVKQKK